MLIVSPNICIYDCVYSESLLSSKNNSTAYWTLVHEYQNYIKHTMSKAKCLFSHSSFCQKCFSLSSLFHFSFFIALFHYSQLKILDSFLRLLFSHTLHHIPILCFFFFFWNLFSFTFLLPISHLNYWSLVLQPEITSWNTFNSYSRPQKPAKT